MKSRKKYRPGFDKYGGYYHLRISTVEDLEYIISLPDGRWIATSCPLFGVNVDTAFLRFLDMNGNGRIISDEIREAIRWLMKFLKRSETWLEFRPSLPLDLIKTDTPEGTSLRDAAVLVLNNMDMSDADEILLTQVRNRQKIMSQADYNGDGIIPPEVVKEPEAAQFVRDLMATVGSAPDASGLKGISEAILDQFKKEANAYLQWHAQGVIPEGQSETSIMPFGISTPDMFQTISGIREKIEQFFAQCALVRFDPRMTGRMLPGEDEMAGLDYTDRQAILEHLRVAPLAKPDPKGILPLDEGVNDFYRRPMRTLREQVIAVVFGEETREISESQWRELLNRFAPYEKWLKAKPANAVEPMGVDKIRSYLNASHDATIRTLIAEDKDVADEIQQLQNLEKLVLYHQYLFSFVNNYVSLPNLFDPATRAMVEMGRLVLGGHEFDFSIRVENRSIHANLAKNSVIYLLYLQITGSKPEDYFEVAVPVTGGNTRNFYVGKRGVFFTIDGREMDAQIVQIVENPVSFYDSIKEPFRRVYAMVGGRVSQISSAFQKEAEKAITTTPGDQQFIQKEMQQAQQVTAPPATVTTAPMPQPVQGNNTQRNSSSTRDLMVGTGLLVAGLGTALKFVVDAARHLAQPKTLQVLLIMLGVFLIIAVLASVISAWKRLRQRDLGVLLQASGWSINGRMRLIRPMARIFCLKVRIPKGANKHHRERLVPLEKLARKKKKEDNSVG